MTRIGTKMSISSSKSGEFGDFGQDGDVDLGAVYAREQRVRAGFWDKFTRVAGKIPFADDLVSAYYCALDPETPLRVRGMLLGALAYFILPTDAIPDLIAGFGYTDDAAVLATVVALVAQHIHPRHRVAAAKALGKDAPGDTGTG